MANLENLTFRRATLDDYENVVSINKEVYDGFDYIPFNYQALLKNGRTYGYLAEGNGKPVSLLLSIFFSCQSCKLLLQREDTNQFFETVA